MLVALSLHQFVKILGRHSDAAGDVGAELAEPNGLSTVRQPIWGGRLVRRGDREQRDLRVLRFVERVDVVLRPDVDAQAFDLLPGLPVEPFVRGTTASSSPACRSTSLCKEST